MLACCEVTDALAAAGTCHVHHSEEEACAFPVRFHRAAEDRPADSRAEDTVAAGHRAEEDIHKAEEDTCCSGAQVEDTDIQVGMEVEDIHSSSEDYRRLCSLSEAQNHHSQHTLSFSWVA